MMTSFWKRAGHFRHYRQRKGGGSFYVHVVDFSFGSLSIDSRIYILRLLHIVERLCVVDTPNKIELES